MGLDFLDDGGHEMIVKRRGGMPEFIPSPQEKREGVVRDYSFNLIEICTTKIKRSWVKSAKNI